jgi:hypothetical protein
MRAALALGLAAVFATFPLPGRSAEITRVADAPAEGEPMDLSLDVNFRRSNRTAHILKEWHQGAATAEENPRIVESQELSYEETRSTLELVARAGVAHNVELSAGLPIVLSRTISWRLPPGVDPSESLILTNEYGYGVCPGRSADFGGWTVDRGDDPDPYAPDRFENWRCVPNAEAIAAGAVPRPYVLFGVPGEAHFSGVGDPWFGITVGILDDDPDGGDPAWIVGLRYHAPLSPIADPTGLNTESDPGGAGEGYHRLAFRTALSKRYGIADPYVELQYTLSLASGKSFDNCEHRDVLGTPENCDSWDSGDTGAQPRHVAGLTVGSELVPWSEPAKGLRFWLDGRVGAEYHSEGRDYSEAAWMLRKFTYTEDFARLSGKVRAAFDGGRHVSVGLEAGLAWDSPHYLTRESIGQDFDGNGQVDLDNLGGEINPNFDFRYDVPGRRLRLVDAYEFTFGAFARLAL